MISTLSMTINRGLPVNLPKAASSQRELRESFNITVTREGDIFLNKEPITLHEIGQRVQAGLVKDPELFAVINADDHALHGTVVDIMDKVRLAGGLASDYCRQTGAEGHAVNAGLPAMLFTSIVLHLLGLTALSMVSGSLWTVTPSPSLIPTEMLVEPPPPVVSELDPLSEPEPLSSDPVEQAEPVPPPPAEPEPQPVIPPKLEKVIPPKLVAKPMPERVVPRSKPVPPVSRARQPEPAASPPPGTPPPGSPVPLPPEAQAAAGRNVLGPPVERPPDAVPPLPVEGGEAGAGKLFDKGDVGVVPGAGAGGGSGGPGRAGLGTGGAGASGGTRVAGLPPGAGLER